MLFSVALAIRRPEHTKEANISDGDIVAIQPQGWEWGNEEYKYFTIVEMDIDAKDLDEARQLCFPHYEDGSLEHPDPDDPNPPKMTAMWRYNVPTANIAKIQLNAQLRVGKTELEKQSITDTIHVVDKVTYKNLATIAEITDGKF
jgi:hypothetical protein